MSCFTPIADKLRAAGYRLTPQRLMVLEALHHNPDYATAEEIWERVTARVPQVDLSTVYRQLHFLKDQGLVSEITSLSGPACYAPVREEQPHAHAVCRNCGDIMHVDMGWVADMVAQVRAKHGFQVDIANMELPGVCKQCSREMK